MAKQSEAALNYMLESVRKFMDIAIHAPGSGRYFECICGAIFYDFLVMPYQCF